MPLMILWRKKPHQSFGSILLIILIILPLLSGCAGWKSAPALEPTLTLVMIPSITPFQAPQAIAPVEETAQPVQSQPAAMGEPAGCLTPENQVDLASADSRLEYASRLVPLRKPFAGRRLESSWNAYTQTNLLPESGALSFAVGDIDPQYMVQRALNALQVAGFVTWLRKTPKQGLHILAIPLIGTNWAESPWAPYVEAYWANSRSIPGGDPSVIRALKTPPCRWIVEQGYAPGFQAGHWEMAALPSPDYAAAGAAYLANTTADATRLARQINWLGDGGFEGPDTMCGPLAWSIMHDAGALPPGYGDWSAGPQVFWLSDPQKNGRPWSLFPPEWYVVQHYDEPLGTFDFRTRQPLYPGDFLYTYAMKDGFDHMLVVTETDASGDVFTVTNIIQLVPDKATTIQRVLLLNLEDPSQGIARNRWAKDRANGRTGQDGFDVFRWAWVQKNIDRQPVEYTVQPGDSIFSIAFLWRTPADQIARYNGIMVDSALNAGQTLFIPPNG